MLRLLVWSTAGRCLGIRDHSAHRYGCLPRHGTIARDWRRSVLPCAGTKIGPPCSRKAATCCEKPQEGDRPCFPEICKIQVCYREEVRSPAIALVRLGSPSLCGHQMSCVEMWPAYPGAGHTACSRRVQDQHAPTP